MSPKLFTCVHIVSVLLCFINPRPTFGTDCSQEGTDSTYTESITGRKRNIEASGCPNHVSFPINPNNAEVQSHSITMMATPCFAAEPTDITCKGGTIGITFNGVSIFSYYPGGECGAADAVQAEGDTFDVCSGHSNKGGNYHYHIAPSCLLTQMDDSSTTNAVGHSAQIGWALDGFPVYGPAGNDGQMMYPCTHTPTDANDCLDECGGHRQHNIGGFKYHYHIAGPVGDMASCPTQPLPGADMIPYTIGCFVGVRGMNNNYCQDTAGGDGVEPNYTPQASTGVTAQFTEANSDNCSKNRPSEGNVSLFNAYNLGFILVALLSLNLLCLAYANCYRKGSKTERYYSQVIVVDTSDDENVNGVRI